MLDRELPEFTVNPCAASKLPRIDKGDREALQALSPGEFALLLQYIPAQYQDFITISAALATRFSETTAFPVSAWHPERGPHGELQVFRAWKRQKSGAPELGVPKTRKSIRPLPVSREIAEIIERAAAGKKADELLFTTPNGARIDHNSFYGNVWQPALRLANGLPLLHRRTRKPMIDD